MDKRLVKTAAWNSTLLSLMFLFQGIGQLTSGHEVWGAVGFLATYFTATEAINFFKMYKEAK